MTAQKGKAYRVKFLPMFLVFAVFGFFVLIVGDLILKRPMAISVATAMFGSLIVSPIITFYYVVTISEKGIKGYNFWAIYRFVEWDSIIECRRINFLGLVFVRAYTSDGKSTLWLPLFLKDMSGFTEDVVQFAGEGNCLREFLLEKRNA